ncbi:hypothetical protein [Williamsia sp.]|uniref:hypothetical protein n=1 Tax=Williamsia sp. TaxID=1872085 RepID=UPI002F952122
MRKILGVIAALAAAAVLTTGSVASAAPTPDYHQLPDLSGYSAVDPGPYRSPDYADNGRTFFVTPSGRTCALGPGYGYNGCSGHPKTAPPGNVGVAISGGQIGPKWTPSDTSYRTTPHGWFKAPLLDIGQSITLDGSTCAVSPVGVTCVAGPRAFTITAFWFKFVYPPGDQWHDANSDPKFLPADQR